MKLWVPQTLYDSMIQHAHREAPIECCGLAAGTDGHIHRVHEAENIAASPLRFELDAWTQIRLIDQIDANEHSLLAIYHSHTRSAPFPSQTDLLFARGWPDVLWIIIGLHNGHLPEVRTWRIEQDGRYEPAELAVV